MGFTERGSSGGDFGGESAARREGSIKAKARGSREWYQRAKSAAAIKKGGACEPAAVLGRGGAPARHRVDLVEMQRDLLAAPVDLLTQGVEPSHIRPP